MKHGDPEYIRPNYLKRGDKCTLKDCSDKPYAKLLCRTHYDRKRAHGDPNITLHRTTCIIPDCNAKHAGLGYCSKHYARFSKYGDPHFLKEVQNKGRMKHRLYTRYRGMMDRCYYVRSYKYPRYGGRGIKVCGRWLDRINGFENYIIDIESLPNAYKSGWTIDRINNDGDYEPNNVRWASATVQANNQERILTKLSFIKETK
jgi:hypothetical protein